MYEKKLAISYEKQQRTKALIQSRYLERQDNEARTKLAAFIKQDMPLTQVALFIVLCGQIEQAAAQYNHARAHAGATDATNSKVSRGANKSQDNYVNHNSTRPVTTQDKSTTKATTSTAPSHLSHSSMFPPSSNMPTIADKNSNKKTTGSSSETNTTPDIINPQVTRILNNKQVLDKKSIFKKCSATDDAKNYYRDQLHIRFNETVQAIVSASVVSDYHRVIFNFLLIETSLRFELATNSEQLGLYRATDHVIQLSISFFALDPEQRKTIILHEAHHALKAALHAEKNFDPRNNILAIAPFFPLTDAAEAAFANIINTTYAAVDHFESLLEKEKNKSLTPNEQKKLAKYRLAITNFDPIFSVDLTSSLNETQVKDIQDRLKIKGKPVVFSPGIHNVNYFVKDIRKVQGRYILRVAFIKKLHENSTKDEMFIEYIRGKKLTAADWYMPRYSTAMSQQQKEMVFRFELDAIWAELDYKIQSAFGDRVEYHWQDFYTHVQRQIDLKIYSEKNQRSSFWQQPPANNNREQSDQKETALLEKEKRHILP